MKYGSYFSEEREFDSKNLDSIQTSNHVTLSPQKQQMLREEARARVLESQPRSSIGDPLQTNLEILKRQRYGRPYTNSPFPYM
jgi:hypothetical protein